MKTSYGHLTYCTNIHAGEHWSEHFAALRENIPVIKKNLSPDQPFGIGLRLSNVASLELAQENHLHQFKKWLKETNCYVFTMNGFPYGGFHHTKVKDNVHLPDWTSTDRLVYTLRLFHILSRLLPPGMEGGISTSPLSYKHWHLSPVEVFKTATLHILHVAEELIRVKRNSGKVLHLDIEPEPDGLLESGPEFLKWYNEYLLPMGQEHLEKAFGFSSNQAVEALHEHIQLCYDVCHFAVGYEEHRKIIQELQQQGIRTGKIQISAALKAPMPLEQGERDAVHTAFSVFNESTYLHQVVALQRDGSLKRYPDLPQALKEVHSTSVQEWRSHFHVPLFVERYGILESTQSDITEVLTIQGENSFTTHLEVETYTWEVLPKELKLPLTDSIIRELQWVKQVLKTSDKVSVTS